MKRSCGEVMPGSAYPRTDAKVDAAIKAGFVLPEDRGALVAYAEPKRISG